MNKNNWKKIGLLSLFIFFILGLILSLVLFLKSNKNQLQKTPQNSEKLVDLYFEEIDVGGVDISKNITIYLSVLKNKVKNPNLNYRWDSRGELNVFDDLLVFEKHYQNFDSTKKIRNVFIKKLYFSRINSYETTQNSTFEFE
jgi:hypothetical protein